MNNCEIESNFTFLLNFSFMCIGVLLNFSFMCIGVHLRGQRTRAPVYRVHVWMLICVLLMGEWDKECVCVPRHKKEWRVKSARTLHMLTHYSHSHQPPCTLTCSLIILILVNHHALFTCSFSFSSTTTHSSHAHSLFSFSSTRVVCMDCYTNKTGLSVRIVTHNRVICELGCL